MRAMVLAIICGSIPGATATVLADDLEPDWLPPPLQQKPLWDLYRDTAPARPGEDFSALLLHASRNTTDTAPRAASGRLNLSGESSIENALLKSKIDLPDVRELRELPFLSRDWTAQQTVNLSLPAVESVFLYGNFDSKGDTYNSQQVKVKGKTGVGWKWTPFGGSELQVRTGPIVSFQERSQLSVELQAKVALFGPLQLQYSGEALPAIVQTDRHTFLQDLKLAVPLGVNHEFHVGAKYRWEDSLSSTPWMDRAQLYMGLKFQH